MRVQGVDRFGRNPIAIAASAFALFAMAFWIATRGFGESLPLPLGVALIALVYSMRARRPRGRTGELEVRDGEVFLDGKHVAQCSQLVSAVVVPREGQSVIVRLERRWAGPIDLTMPSIEAGRAVVEAVGLDARRMVASLPIRAFSPSHYRKRVMFAIGYVPIAVPLLFFIGSFRFLQPLVPVTALALVCAFPLVLLQIFKHGRATVGADGVLVEWLWQKRFIPTSDIEHVEVVQGDKVVSSSPVCLRLFLRGNDALDVMIGVGGAYAIDQVLDDPHAVALALKERVESSLALRKRDASAATASSLLARNARTIEGWLGALREMTKGVATFRESGASIDDLWRLLEASDVEPTLRAASAVALAPVLDEAGKARMRVAAKAVVAPTLRIAFDAAADDDAAAQREALEEVQREAERSFRARA